MQHLRIEIDVQHHMCTASESSIYEYEESRVRMSKKVKKLEKRGENEERRVRMRQEEGKMRRDFEKRMGREGLE